jgi:hypothetical protein
VEVAVVSFEAVLEALTKPIIGNQTNVIVPDAEADDAGGQGGPGVLDHAQAIIADAHAPQTFEPTWLNNPAYFREGVDFALLDEQDSKKKILGGDPQLSNAVIETFTQPWKPMMTNSRQSNFCFDCHRTTAHSKSNLTLPALRLNVSQTLVQRYFLAAGAR